MVIAFIITDPIIHWITEPIRQIAAERGDAALNFAAVTSAFDMRMRIAFTIGIFISAPVWLWQIWAFIMPGLTRKEIRYTIGFVAAAVPLFFAGCYVGVLVVPLGVIGFIYESRPNVTADAVGLCVKAGNAVLLRGGSEAIESNALIAAVLARALEKAGGPLALARGLEIAYGHAQNSIPPAIHLRWIGGAWYPTTHRRLLRLRVPAAWARRFAGYVWRAN